MEAVHGIRHLGLAEGWRIRRAARESDVSRNTVRRYLAGRAGRAQARRACTRILESVRSRIDEMLADMARWTQGKPRLTALRARARRDRAPRRDPRRGRDRACAP